MLKVLFGKKLDDEIIFASTYFNNVYEYEWFDDPIVKQMIQDIDNSEINGTCVISPVLGSIPIEKLSGGVKGLILMYKLDDFVSNLINYGNNCEDWIIELSKNKDITVSMTGVDMTFEGKDIKAYCLNDSTYINSWQEWCRKMLDYRSVL